MVEQGRDQERRFFDPNKNPGIREDMEHVSWADEQSAEKTRAYEIPSSRSTFKLLKRALLHLFGASGDGQDVSFLTAKYELLQLQIAALFSTITFSWTTLPSSTTAFVTTSLLADSSPPGRFVLLMLRKLFKMDPVLKVS
ncbi:hypothetical protein RvY_12325 [Ramazzottius varieornatus]|uniref:Uncharacterized protein n=1 Tax=Ramazzottius varieornatus TaxID=947166 RepID=A0A1D1VJ46_RAMVA|nr:hypothetical protein RvY_12325 [Ramazzottius varieornatus]